MNTPSKYLAAAALATGLNACGSAPVQKTQAELTAQSEAESKSRLKQVQEAVKACTSALPTKVAACAQLPDAAYPFEPETTRNDCVVGARTEFVSCLTKASDIAVNAYDRSNCAPITTANSVCAQAFVGEKQGINKDLCESDVNDTADKCVK